MIKNYIFDFDGTLADSSIGIYKAFSSSCTENDLKPPDIRTFKKHIGPPIYKLIYLIYPDIKEHIKDKFVRTFRNEYDNKFYKFVDWYEGVFETIDYLKKIERLNLFIITNKPTLTCISLLSEANILNSFKKVIGIDYKIFKNEKNASNFENKKCAFDYFFEKTNLSKDQSVYIGDTLNDKISAESCHLNFIAVKYGFYNWNSNDTKLKSIDSISELKQLSKLLK